ncbi:MAG TPA: hypothetical protein VF186_03125 [Gaiellaceae bacterium]|jgi:hypothetical protein
MLRRRRDSRKLIRVARMLRELDACASPAARAARPPAARVGLGRAA